MFMQEFSVLRKGKYFVTRPSVEVEAMVNSGFEHIQVYRKMRTTSNTQTGIGFVEIAVPVGIHPSVIKLENMYDPSFATDEDKIPEYGEMVLIGPNDAVPAEITTMPDAVEPEPTKVELVNAPVAVEPTTSRKAKSNAVDSGQSS